MKLTCYLRQTYYKQLLAGVTVEPFLAETVVVPDSGALWGDFIIMPPILKEPRTCTIVTTRSVEMDRACILQFNRANKGKTNKEVYSNYSSLFDKYKSDDLWEELEPDPIGFTGIDASNEDIYICYRGSRLNLDLLALIARDIYYHKVRIENNYAVYIGQQYYPPSDECLLKIPIYSDSAAILFSDDLVKLTDTITLSQTGDNNGK
jgi:hypothetical protein